MFDAAKKPDELILIKNCVCEFQSPQKPNKAISSQIIENQKLNIRHQITNNFVKLKAQNFDLQFFVKLYLTNNISNP